VKIYSNTTAIGTEIKERIYSPLKGLRYIGVSREIPHLHCQPLNEVWEGVHPGSSPSNHSVHCMHLSSAGLALPSHQVLNHCFKPWLSISTRLPKWTWSLCSFSEHLPRTKIDGWDFWRAEYLYGDTLYLRSVYSFSVALVGCRKIRKRKCSTSCKPGKTHQDQGTSTCTWKSCQCWWNCYHYSFLSKPSKPVGWSTIFWCFKLWPGQCSLYSSGHINVTSQQDTRMSDLVFSFFFF